MPFWHIMDARRVIPAALSVPPAGLFGYDQWVFGPKATPICGKVPGIALQDRQEPIRWIRRILKWNGPGNRTSGFWDFALTAQPPTNIVDGRHYYPGGYP